MDPTLDMTFALPDAFPFYHLGKVEASSLEQIENLSGTFEDSTGVAFALQGDSNGLMIMLFDKGLDVSTYTEIGNVIASRLADKLSRTQKIDILISPPKILTPDRISTLIKKSSMIQTRSYSHISEDKAVKLLVMILTSSTTGKRERFYV